MGDAERKGRRSRSSEARCPLPAECATAIDPAAGSHTPRAQFHAKPPAKPRSVGPVQRSYQAF
eukprot:768717-Hanusia_phi.AAC.3